MDSLQEDVRRYLRVYRRNVSDVLHQQLPETTVAALEEKLKASLTELLANQDH